MKRLCIALFALVLTVLSAAPARAAEIGEYQVQFNTALKILTDIKDTGEFARYGFGKKNPEGVMWMLNMTRIRDELKQVKDLPYQVAETPDNFIRLGNAMFSARKKGLKTPEQIKAYEDTIMDARLRIQAGMDYRAR